MEKNKYFDWLVGDRKHFPKMDLPEVETPMIFKDLETPKIIAKQESEEAEIDEGGEELEDEEKIADAIDTTDLGARSDMEWEKEKDERLGL